MLVIKLLLTRSLCQRRRKKREKCAVCVAEESIRTNRETQRNWYSAQSARKTVSTPRTNLLCEATSLRDFSFSSHIIMQIIRAEKLVDYVSPFERFHCLCLLDLWMEFCPQVGLCSRKTSFTVLSCDLFGGHLSFPTIHPRN